MKFVCLLVVALVGAATLDVKVEQLDLVDRARSRAVPVLTYGDADRARRLVKPAILSHGYGGKHSDYSFIAERLVAQGYFVSSVQHEVPGDEPLPSTGKPYETRMPSWRRGVQNILFVIDELKQRQPQLDFAQLLLVGHSHGADTSMLFAREQPSRVRAVIALDNRRMPIPRLHQPRLFTIRSSDQAADDGVLPSVDEQATFGIRVGRLPATIHNDMWDGGTAAQKAEMLRLIDGFLRELK